ncbi:FERM, ARH/RhoGEF and pleckstrin domain protein 1 [Homo sapiens]|uniref:Isoform 3 of FERM, ARHGEF and pleckstrin domain-containing protein 1 n=1 Tax=Homo sapiens TaxID=9606 RepID=Q9Y4F1-3|nr:FERM, ARHGEF and pleckstrin domain-containing protein 1 isoform 2 [Homo sapiens]KAI2569751.1 FERM, ARH/RhoGEF and pleckstrin domain protein 1 [Homo sapiens]KAI4063662.1 FERM, ARH/RhoGEF and pleckstrin domain protein 1 [Homo sapiens]|eukprot:NP_001001715.2 FERM, ARHGEF and pleckstrin domain-containing protein 1 isoform 2 [Homo sapiens]
MGEIEQRPTPGSRLGAPENSGISTLERGQKPPPTPSGKLVSIKIQMLDDTQEAFEVPMVSSSSFLKATGSSWTGWVLRCSMKPKHHSHLIEKFGEDRILTHLTGSISYTNWAGSRSLAVTVTEELLNLF